MNRSRRNFLVQLATSGVVSPLRFVFAADATNPEVVSAISKNIKDAEELQMQVSRIAPDMNDGNAKSLMEQERQLRVNLLTVLQKISEPRLPLYVMSDQSDLAKAITGAKLSLLPNKEEINEANVRRKPPPPKCDESLLSVVWAILLEALELQELSAAIIKVVEQTPDLKEKLDQLAKAIEMKSWQELINLLTPILSHVFLHVLTELARNPKIRLLLLRKLRVKFVPFVGPVYMVAIGATALINNRGRLLKAMECARS